MIRRAIAAAMSIAALGLSGTALSQQDDAGPGVISDDLEVTMMLFPEEGSRPDVITHRIQLPEPRSGNGDEAAGLGEDIAEEARQGRQFGQETAAEARDRGREFGQDMAERARENREDSGRGNPPFDPPDGPPDDLPVPPGVPPEDLPMPPDAPPDDVPMPPDAPPDDLPMPPDGLPEGVPDGPPETPPRGPQ